MKNAIYSISLLWLILAAPAAAEVKEIIAEGTYNMGDGETPSVAESRALLNAKRTAIEQAGTYVESYSKVKNLQLTQDEINVVASGVIEVTVLDKKRTVVGDGFRFWVKIKALVDSDKMDKMAGKAKDKALLEDYKKVQAAYDKGQKDIEALKAQLVQAKGDSDRKQAEKKIAQEERRFQAIAWIEKGKRATNAFSDRADYNKAIEAFTSAIALDPDNCDAYVERGMDLERMGELERALEDMDRAVGMECGKDVQGDALYYTYYGVGRKYVDAKKHIEAIDAFNKAEKYYGHWGVYPASDPLYFWRGIAYLRSRQFERAVTDFNKALRVDPENSSNNNGYIYDNRALAYYNAGDKSSALDDARKGCSLGVDHACTLVDYISKQLR